MENPLPPDSAPLHGAEDYRRVTVGEYRLIYRYDDGFVFLAAAGRRNDTDVYRKFLRSRK